MVYDHKLHAGMLCMWGKWGKAHPNVSHLISDGGSPIA